jgi:hypothetical protein
VVDIVEEICGQDKDKRDEIEFQPEVRMAIPDEIQRTRLHAQQDQEEKGSFPEPCGSRAVHKEFHNDPDQDHRDACCREEYSHIFKEQFHTPSILVCIYLQLDIRVVRKGKKCEGDYPGNPDEIV